MELKVEGSVTLTDVFEGVTIETDAGWFVIAQRDGGIEVWLGDKLVYPASALEAQVQGLRESIDRVMAALSKEKAKFHSYSPHLTGFQKAMAIIDAEFTEEADVFDSRMEAAIRKDVAAVHAGTMSLATYQQKYNLIPEEVPNDHHTT